MIISGFSPFEGQHCETTALGAVLRHAGLELSEPMMFGLGEGLSFIYWDAAYMDFPFLGGRSKPMMVTRTVARNLGLTMHVNQTSSARKAWQTVTSVIDGGQPVGLQLDSFHLDYFSTKVHFGGHVVAMYGYDDTDAYLVDTAPQGGHARTSRKSLEAARSEKGPMTAKNLSYTIAVDPRAAVTRTAVVTAIQRNAEHFLNAPIGNLGHRGIAKAAALVPTWLDRAANPRDALALAASLMERGGTGGALFRNLYRDFLAECCTIVDDENLRAGHGMYAEIATLWTEVSACIDAAGSTADQSHLTEAAKILLDLSQRERDAMQTLARIRVINTAAA